MRKEIDIDEWEKLLKEDYEEARQKLEDTIREYASYVANTDPDEAENLLSCNFSTLKDDIKSYRKAKSQLELMKTIKKISKTEV